MQEVRCAGFYINRHRAEKLHAGDIVVKHSLEKKDKRDKAELEAKEKQVTCY